ncbi:hypothetical protein PYCC9005_001448 [Savitreella phatthalungensis]
MRMGSNDLLRVWDEELAIVVEQAIESLENIRRREVELVQDEPSTFTDGLDEDALLKHQIPAGIGCVRSQVFLQIGMLMVINANEWMACALRKILNHTCLAG